MNKTSNSAYDLEERTAQFAEKLIDFVKTVKKDCVNERIMSQLVGSVGSVGANYCEATEAESKRDFVHKIGICKKEAKEGRFWLRLLARNNPEHKERIREFWKEANELLFIFAKISRSSKTRGLAKRKFEH